MDTTYYSQATGGDYLQLLKPRVMSLVVFTGAVGLALAPVTLHPFLAFLAVLSIAMGSGASGALNMWYERDIDALMTRTKSRPLPLGRIDPDSALAFGLVLSVFSVMLMGLALNWVAASLLAFTIFFYVGIYTIWLKRRTPQNIVIGGAAGAFPPVIGWAAATGHLAFEPFFLFMVVFLWTPPHFWALSLFKAQDYENAGVPMLPVVAGVQATKKQILIYTLLVVLFANLGLFFWGTIYGIGVNLLGLWFLSKAYQLYRTEDHEAAKDLFFVSLWYLFLFFCLVLLDHGL